MKRNANPNLLCMVGFDGDGSPDIRQYPNFDQTHYMATQYVFIGMQFLSLLIMIVKVYKQAHHRYIVVLRKPLVAKNLLTPFYIVNWKFME